MSDTPTVDEFTEEVTAFFEANAERKVDDDGPFTWGKGRDDTSLFEEVDREAEKQHIAAAKEWRAKRYDAGLGWISGPKAYDARKSTKS